MKIALVHDYLVERGGAEKALAALHGAFPDAPIYTSLYDRNATLLAFQDADVRTSFLQRLGADARRYRALLPLYPLAFRSFDLSGFDVVISSASGFAKGVRPAAGALQRRGQLQQQRVFVTAGVRLEHDRQPVR
jgi:hypothetical protein